MKTIGLGDGKVPKLELGNEGAPTPGSELLQENSQEFVRNPPRFSGLILEPKTLAGPPGYANSRLAPPPRGDSLWIRGGFSAKLWAPPKLASAALLFFSGRVRIWQGSSSNSQSPDGPRVKHETGGTCVLNLGWWGLPQWGCESRLLPHPPFFYPLVGGYEARS